MKIKPGRMRTTVTIESSTPGTLGQPQYATFATVRGELQAANGRETIGGHLVGSEVSHIFVTRFIAGVTPKMRLNLSPRSFIIKYVATADEGNPRLLMIYCREVVTV